MNILTLEFEGYWLESTLPFDYNPSGIYGVYTCSDSMAGVRIHRLLYIGESTRIFSRIRDHTKSQLWKKHVRLGQSLCFNLAYVHDDALRKIAEASMIYEHKPPCNMDYKDSIPYNQITVRTSGANSLMKSIFTI